MPLSSALKRGRTKRSRDRSSLEERVVRGPVLWRGAARGRRKEKKAERGGAATVLHFVKRRVWNAMIALKRGRKERRIKGPGPTVFNNNRLTGVTRVDLCKRGSGTLGRKEEKGGGKSLNVQLKKTRICEDSIRHGKALNREGRKWGGEPR